MSAPQSPIACTLAWLTVFALLLSGVPARRSTQTLETSLERASANARLASVLQSLDLAQQQSPGAPQLFKAWLIFATPSTAPFSFPRASSTLPVQSPCLTRISDRRPSLVGTIELRI